MGRLSCEKLSNNTATKYTESGNTKKNIPLRRGGLRGRRSEGNIQIEFLSLWRSHPRPESEIWIKRSTWLHLTSQLGSFTSLSEKDKFKARRCSLLLREQRDPPYLGYHGVPLPGAPRRRFLP